MKLTFIGHGYVGLVTAAVFADLGNTVFVIGHTEKKINDLKRGIIPIYEPGLSELVERNINAGRLIFTLDYASYISESDIVFIAVGTPSKENGEADLSTVFRVAEKIGTHLSGYTVVATKSTVPIGTNREIKMRIAAVKAKKAEFDVASVPEFLREGSAIQDTLHPDRIVIGTEHKKARHLLQELHKPISTNVLFTNLETAEMIKYASNSFLAMKISFANAVAKLSELAGADGTVVLEATGLDKRIGNEFLKAGAGYGGSCFPKDVKAFISIAHKLGYEFDLLKAVEQINKTARKDIVNKAEHLLGDLSGKTIGILGLSFKPNTDDIRDAPSVDIVGELQKKGAEIKAYDPVSIENSKSLIKNASYGKDIYDTVEGADIMVLVTEWNEFKEADLNKIKELMRGNQIVDARNVYDPKELRDLGFEYIGVGRI